MIRNYLVNALVVLFNIEFISPTNIRLTRDGQPLHVMNSFNNSMVAHESYHRSLRGTAQRVRL